MKTKKNKIKKIKNEEKIFSEKEEKKIKKINKK